MGAGNSNEILAYQVTKTHMFAVVYVIAQITLKTAQV